MALSLRASHRATAKRNKAAAARKERADKIRQDQEWFESETREFELGIAAAVKKGHRLFRYSLGTTRVGLSTAEFLKQGDGPMYKRIIAKLRRADYKVVVKMKATSHSGESMYEGVPDTDPYTSYEYKAVVTW